LVDQSATISNLMSVIPLCFMQAMLLKTRRHNYLLQLNITTATCFGLTNKPLSSCIYEVHKYSLMHGYGTRKV